MLWTGNKTIAFFNKEPLTHYSNSLHASSIHNGHLYQFAISDLKYVIWMQGYLWSSNLACPTKPGFSYSEGFPMGMLYYKDWKVPTRAPVWKGFFPVCHGDFSCFCHNSTHICFCHKLFVLSGAAWIRTKLSKCPSGSSMLVSWWERFWKQAA